MKKLLLMLMCCINFAIWAQEKEYNIKRSDIMIFQNDSTIKIISPQGTYISYYIIENVYNGDMLAFEGYKSTVLWGNGWISITFDDGRYIVWRFTII